MTLLLSHLTGYQTLLANSAAFQTLTGAADATAALDYIHIYRAEPDADWPAYAAVTDPDEDAITMRREISGQGMGAYEGVRSAQITIFKMLDADESWTAANSAAFLEAFGTIIGEILALEGTDSYAVVDELRKVPNGRAFTYRAMDDGRRCYQLAVVLMQTLYGDL